MFNEIGKFLGLVKEEQTLITKTTGFISENYIGMIAGACLITVLIALIWGTVRIVRFLRNRKKREKNGLSVMQRMRLRIIRGKIAKKIMNRKVVTKEL